MTLGIVNRWFADKGFGFIRQAAENYKGEIVRVNDRAIKDVFVHAKQAQRDGIDDLAEGDVVQFDIGTDRRTGRLHAINLVKFRSAEG
jgi:cold shock CspA family protein